MALAVGVTARLGSIEFAFRSLQKNLLAPNEPNIPLEIDAHPRRRQHRTVRRFGVEVVT